MANTTIALDPETLAAAREHAEKLGLSFNGWVKTLIHDALRRPADARIEELLDLSDRIAGDSGGKSWTRDEIYER